MTSLLVLEQTLNGLQQGAMLFLMAAGLTLIFGIMNIINLAHGSLYMVGAYAAATLYQVTGNFLIAAAGAIAAGGAAGALMEVIVLRRLYQRDHLDQVLATFGLILFFNELVKIVWGSQALFLQTPAVLAGSLHAGETFQYPLYRLVIIGLGLGVALGLRLLIARTRLGMLIRAGASDPETLGALGVNVRLLFTFVFALGAMLAGLAGALAGPVLAIQVGMGEDILILTFVVIIIGGIGSVRGALVAALLVGLVDTYGRAFLPALLRALLPATTADALGASVASIAIYLLMAVVLVVRPKGLFHG